MHLLLVDRKPEMIAAWREYFGDEPNVTLLQGDITTVSCDAIVSPANSFGFMDGGLDYAISMRLGWDLQFELQKQIQALPEGELLIGRALTISTGDEQIPYLISAPTMRVPMNFNTATSINAYLAMKAILIEAKRHGAIEYIAVPGLCTGIGRMPFHIAARQMHAAYLEIVKGEKQHFEDFGQAQKYQVYLNPDGMIFD